MDELELMHTAMHLANTATTQPFSFYGKDEVSKNIKSMKAALDDTNFPCVETENISVDSDVPVVVPPTVTSPSSPAPTPRRILTSSKLPAPPTPPEPLCSPTPKSPTPLPPVPPNESASQQINNPALSMALGENADNTVHPPKMGTKRKRAKSSKITVPDVTSAMSVTDSGTSKIARCGVRSRKLAAIGPVLVVDPTLPPPKKVK